MENATRALVMAGGILIALLILGALLLMFNNLSSYQNANDSSEKTSQIAEFNNQFEPYNKKNLTLMELKSIYNKIESNNSKNPEYFIDNNISSVYESIDEDFTKISEDDKQTKKFKCTSVRYDKEGRINEMNFSTN